MNKTDQVRMLLKKGYRPKELEDMGLFSKALITRGKRELKREVDEAKAVESQSITSTKEAPIASHVEGESEIDDLKKRVESLEELSGTAFHIAHTVADEVEGIKTRFNDTLTKDSFKCMQCGEEGSVAVSVQCTQCKTPTWWGWRPKSGTV